jgi:CheY-like chemotaxis protein
LPENSEQILSKINNGYDLILMDVGLPGISGIEVVAEIRRRENGQSHIPIVVLTAYTPTEIQEACLKAGADAVFTKPIMMEMLKQILQDFVNTDTKHHRPR